MCLGAVPELLKRGWSPGLSVARRHLLPTGDRRALRQDVWTWRGPLAASCASAWPSLLAASPEFLRSTEPPWPPGTASLQLGAAH